MQLLVKTSREIRDRVRLTVRHSGVEIASTRLDALFDAFYTTKNDGMRVG